MVIGLKNISQHLLIILKNILYVAAGLIFIAIGVFIFTNASTRPAIATGTLVDCVQPLGGQGCRPIVTFKTASSQTITFKSESPTQDYQAGEQVVISYDPAQPQNASIGSPYSFATVFWPFVCVVGGIIYTIVMLKKLAPVAFSRLRNKRSTSSRASS